MSRDTSAGRRTCAAAALLLAGTTAVAQDADAPGLRVELRENAAARGDAAPHRGRFRLRVHGRTATPPTSIGLRLGDLTLDVPLHGRTTRRAPAGDGVHARATVRGERVTVDAWGSARGSGALARRILAACRAEWFGEDIAPHGLFAGEIVLDGAATPIAVAATGRYRVPPGGGAARLRLVAAGVASTPDAAPVVALLPDRRWDGRLVGQALALRSTPTVAWTSGDRGRAVPPSDPPDALNVGDGQAVADGVSSLLLSDGAVAYQARFDAVAPTPPGAREIVVSAEDAAGRRGRSSLAIDEVAHAPPVLADANGQVLEVREGGALWGWGENLFGEVGDGTALDPVSPVPLEGPRQVVSIAAGFEVSFAVDRAGHVWIWGEWDRTRSIGDGVWETFSVAGKRPMRFPGLEGMRAVSAGMWGDGAFTISKDGGLWRLGTDETRPWRALRVNGLPAVVAVSQGTNSALALDRDGGVWDVRALDVRRVTGLPSAKAVSAGEWGQALALGGDGSVWEWNLARDDAPASIALPGRAVSISAGDAYYGAVLEDGTGWTWRDDGDPGLPLPPARLPDLAAVVSMWVGRGVTALAVDGDGTTWTWKTDSAVPGDERLSLAPRKFRPGHLPRSGYAFDAVSAPRRGR